MANISEKLFFTTGPWAFTDAFVKKFPQAPFKPSQQITMMRPVFTGSRYSACASIPAGCRQTSLKKFPARLPDVITEKDIKGIIHTHSNWSDGSNTIEEMAKACISKGFEYLVISDHSKSAFYANGLKEERIREQHRYIDELNEKYKPLKFLKALSAIS